MNTLVLIGGTSGTGKSTRIYALLKFFEMLGEQPTDYLSYENRVIGRVYGSLAVVGKEINRQGKTAWQGLDSFSSSFGSSEKMFGYLYKETLKHNLIADSAALLSSNRSRPLMLEQQNLEIHSKCYFFSYDKLSEYQERIAGRSNGKVMTEDSSMWKNNERFKIFGKHYAEEVAQVSHPERYEFLEGKFNEPLSTVGELLLKLSGKENLIPDYKDFCQHAFFKESDTSLQSEDLF